ncbi:UNVERIFIED_CONTAM: hypothetical protein GTU68_054061 [Idotea baltica]|nr:hypothetical protein [Idotea baltica]
MQEHFVTIDGKRHPLGEFFFVIATQNPVEHEGTYPLPEAQLDRFFIKLEVGYPSADVEVEMIRELSQEDPLMTESRNAAPEDMRVRAGVVRTIALEESLARYIQELAAATRNHPNILLGASPKSALHLSLAAKCTAAFDNRDYVVPDDIKQQVRNVLQHRLILRPEIIPSKERYQQILDDILDHVAIPKVEEAQSA